jgi:hypothetical protein
MRNAERNKASKLYIASPARISMALAPAAIFGRQVAKDKNQNK